MGGLIVVADPVAPGLAADLSGWTVREVLEPSELPGALAEAEALVVRSRTRVTAELLGHAPRLRVVGRAGAGLDGIDLDAAAARGIAVVAAGAAAAAAVAELTLGLMISLARDVPGAAVAARAGNWAKRPGVGLAGRTLGIVGLGRVGRRVAHASAALGMQVVALERGEAPSSSSHAQARQADAATDPASAREVDHITRLPLRALLAKSEILSLHLPLTEATRGLIDAAALAHLPAGALLVNTARGALLDEQALLDALDRGDLAGAALDVLQVEPSDLGNPLLHHPRVLVTPHLGASTADAQQGIARELARELRRVLEG